MPRIVEFIKEKVVSKHSADLYEVKRAIQMNCLHSRYRTIPRGVSNQIHRITKLGSPFFVADKKFEQIGLIY